jgi:hypothetical protein
MAFARVAAVLIATLAVACSSPTAPSPPTPATVALQSSLWETFSEPQPFPLSDDAGALTFDFPSSGSMNYLFTPSPIKVMRGTLVVSLRVNTTGAVVFNSLDQAPCGIAPSVRPFLWANDNGNGNYDRWGRISVSSCWRPAPPRSGCR